MKRVTLKEVRRYIIYLNADARGLEWVGINFFAQDPVGMEEIIGKVDQHTLNAERFGLPERRIAKIFVFRLIYGGSAWAYVYDPDFNWISKDPKYWQRVIDAFYDKYKGIQRQHIVWVQQATLNGQLVMPTGRFYPFERDAKGNWPRTKILNYPVQGLGHDLMAIARVSFKRRLDSADFSDIRNDIKLVSTVHDSIVVDTRPEHIGRISNCLESVFRDIPRNFERLFGVVFNLPLEVEIKVGNDLFNMEELS